MSEAPRTPPVLALEDVALPPRLVDVDLRVASGECCVVACDPAESALLVELVTGMRAPERGQVSFAGTPWGSLGAAATYRQRTRIGCVTSELGWIQNLNVDENVLLRELDASAREEADLRVEAETLAVRLGLDGVPRSRPAATPDFELAASAVVRAFLGRPELVVVATANLAIPTGAHTGLVELARAACARGAAVLWLGDARSAVRDLPHGGRTHLTRGTLTNTQTGRFGEDVDAHLGARSA